MYKFLPILLFTFLLAEENSEPQIIQGDSIDFVMAENELEGMILRCIEYISNIIDEDKFLINFNKEIVDVIKADTTDMDILWSKIEKIRNNLQDSRVIVAPIYKGVSTVAIFIINIEVNVDESIELSDSYRQSILSIINNSFPWLVDFDIEEITFNSVDINKLNNNNQVSLNRDDIYDDSWAVIIGIDKYENLSNLDYAVADAKAVKNMLIEKFDYPIENVKLLLNEEANKTNIVNIISDVSLKAGENDRILVFYAGHGETMPLPEGGEMGYLVPIDGNQDNLFASAIPMDDLKRLSNMSKAKHMLFLVDACYGGLAAVGSRGLEPAKTPNYIEKITNIKSRQIITAGGKDEKVFEKSEWGHSAYTKNLLSALEDGLADSNGDGYITADELGDYLSEKVSIDSENQQTPQSRRLTSHEGEFIFFNSSNKKQIMGIKPKIGKNGLKTIKVKVISEQRLIEHVNTCSWRTPKEKNIKHKIISQLEIDKFQSSLIKKLSNKYYHQKYKFVNYNDMSIHNHNILYTGSDTTIDGFELSNKIRNDCDCYDVWLIGIWEVRHMDGNHHYNSLSKGNTFQNSRNKFSYSFDTPSFGNSADSLNLLIDKIDTRFLKNEINPESFLMGRIVSQTNETLLIQFDDTDDVGNIIDLYFYVHRPYYITTSSDYIREHDTLRFDKDDYLSDLIRIKGFIIDNVNYINHLEEYEKKINNYYSEWNNLINGGTSFGNSYRYTSWNDPINIEIQIVGKRGELFEGKIIETKYPWYKPRVNDLVKLND